MRPGCSQVKVSVPYNVSHEQIIYDQQTSVVLCQKIDEIDVSIEYEYIDLGDVKIDYMILILMLMLLIFVNQNRSLVAKVEFRK